MADNKSISEQRESIGSAQGSVDDMLSNQIDGSIVPEASPDEANYVPPSLRDYVDSKKSSSAPAAPYNINAEITTWKNRIGLSNAMGLAAQKLTNPLMGFNHRMASNPMPTNREYGGLSFITRPDCNLDFQNIANSRIMSNMASQDRASLDYSILAALDPLFEFGFAENDEPRMGKPFHADVPFDNLQAFIPLLSHQLVSFSGPPDQSVDNWLSQEGIEREQWGMVDSTWRINYAYSGSMTFNNSIGDPIMRMMGVWMEYMSGVRRGQFRPRMINSVQRRIDSQSRMYSMKYDAMGNILRFYVGCVMWPMNDNAGAMATVDNSRPINNDEATISIQWQMIGARYNDPLYMDQFNDTVQMFNPDMIADPDKLRQGVYEPIGKAFMVELKMEEVAMFNYYGYPRIDSVKRKLTWWVYKTDYDYIMLKAGLENG